MPDVSYHGENAWRVQSEVSSRQLGIYYCGAKDGRTDCFAITICTGWRTLFALPALPKEKAGIVQPLQMKACLENRSL